MLPTRTFPMYIALKHLHSPLYLEKSRVIWDSVPDRHLIQNKLHWLGNEPHVLVNGSLVLGNGPRM